jgi:ribosome-associated protein
MARADVKQLVMAAVTACEEKKAERITVLELDPADSGFTDYFLICSGTNERQNQTIANAIEDALEKKFKTRPNSVEGYRQAEWILLDYVDFIVHIFSQEKRDFYDIERLRKTANSIKVGDLAEPVVKRIATARKKQPAKAAAKKTPVKKSAAKKTPAKKSASKKTVGRKAASKKAQKASAE